MAEMIPLLGGPQFPSNKLAQDTGFAVCAVMRHVLLLIINLKEVWSNAERTVDWVV